MHKEKDRYDFSHCSFFSTLNVLCYRYNVATVCYDWFRAWVLLSSFSLCIASRLLCHCSCYVGSCVKSFIDNGGESARHNRNTTISNFIMTKYTYELWHLMQFRWITVYLVWPSYLPGYTNIKKTHKIFVVKWPTWQQPSPSPWCFSKLYYYIPRTVLSIPQQCLK
jgi:hypothetical protein